MGIILGPDMYSSLKDPFIGEEFRHSDMQAVLATLDLLLQQNGHEVFAAALSLAGPVALFTLPAF